MPILHYALKGRGLLLLGGSESPAPTASCSIPSTRSTGFYGRKVRRQPRASASWRTDRSRTECGGRHRRLRPKRGVAKALSGKPIASCSHVIRRPRSW